MTLPKFKARPHPDRRINRPGENGAPTRLGLDETGIGTRIPYPVAAADRPVPPDG